LEEEITNPNPWFLYIIRCKDNSLYTGITTAVERRFAEHQEKSGKGAKYLKGRGPLLLVYTEEVGTKSNALKRELIVKKLSKTAKEELL